MPSQSPSADLHRMISEELAHDADAVRRVEQLIVQLRDEASAAERNAQEWQSAAPEWCDYGRIPHC